MGLIIENRSGVEIYVTRNLERKEYYEKAKNYLINPIQKIITINRNEAIFDRFIAGETALSEIATLNPPGIGECAIYKGDEAVDQLCEVDSRYEEWVDCLKVQLWKYNPSYFAKDGVVDPVSLICTFKDNADERIEMSIDELLEEL